MKTINEDLVLWVAIFVLIFVVATQSVMFHSRISVLESSKAGVDDFRSLQTEVGQLNDAVFEKGLYKLILKGVDNVLQNK